MKVKMTRKELFELDIVLKTTKFDNTPDMPIKGVFRYMLTSNLKITGKEIEIINSAFPPADGYADYKTSEADICREFNLPRVEDASKLEDAKRNAFDDAVIALKEKFADAIEAQEIINKEKLAFLDEEIEIDLKTVSAKDFPNIAEDNRFPHWEIWRVFSTIVVE